MKLKYKNEIFTNGYMLALQELIKMPLQAIDAFVLDKFYQQVQKKQRAFKVAFDKILEKYAEKDKKGVKRDKQKRPIFKREEREEADKEFAELLAIKEEYEIRNKLTFPKGKTITAENMGFLADILDIGDGVQDK